MWVRAIAQHVRAGLIVDKPLRACGLYPRGVLKADVAEAEIGEGDAMDENLGDGEDDVGLGLGFARQRPISELAVGRVVEKAAGRPGPNWIGSCRLGQVKDVFDGRGDAAPRVPGILPARLHHSDVEQRGV